MPSDLIDGAYLAEPSHKGRIATHILRELISKGEKGVALSWNLVDEAALITEPFHPENLDRSAFDRAYTRLGEVIGGRKVQSRAGSSVESTDFQIPLTADSAREAELQSIGDRFFELFGWDTSRSQERGYELERLVGRLCLAEGVRWDPPSRQPGQQIDGAIHFENRVIIVESRWRSDKADFGDIAKLSSKAGTRLTGTLGLFISMEGFSEEGKSLWLSAGKQRNCILLRGGEFAKVISRQIDWRTALNYMIERGSVHGDIEPTLPTS